MHNFYNHNDNRFLTSRISVKLIYLKKFQIHSVGIIYPADAVEFIDYDRSYNYNSRENVYFQGTGVVQCTHFRCLSRVRYVPGDVRIRRSVFRYQRTVLPRRHASPSVQPSLLLRSLWFLIDPEELRCLASNIAANLKRHYNDQTRIYVTMNYYRLFLSINTLINTLPRHLCINDTQFHKKETLKKHVFFHFLFLLLNIMLS